MANLEQVFTGAALARLSLIAHVAEESDEALAENIMTLMEAINKTCAEHKYSHVMLALATALNTGFEYYEEVVKGVLES